MTQIYYATLSKEIHDLLLQKYLPGLTNDFRIKILRYRGWENAQLSLLGRMILEYGFYHFKIPFSDKDLMYTEFEKPFLKNSKLKFNISHSGDIVICVLTDSCEVGIDIEEMNDITIQDFKMQMTEGEWMRISTAPNMKKAFYTYWTQKEAVIKAHGMGLSIPLQSFEVINNHCQISNETFYLKEIFIKEDYNCHLAFKDSLDTAEVDLQKLSVNPNKVTNFPEHKDIAAIFELL